VLRHSIFWHLGFWEWLGSAAVFVFLCAAVFVMPSATRLEGSLSVASPAVGDRRYRGNLSERVRIHCSLCNEEMP